MPNLSKIVAGVDFSHRSHQALVWAAHHLAPDAEYVFVHAMEVPVPPSFLGESGDQHAIVEELQAAIQRDMDTLTDELGTVRHRDEIPLGKASKVLNEVAQREEADLILLGPHGERGGIEGLLGSTAERVLSNSTIPVLLAAGDFLGAPRRVLIAIDDSPIRLEVLAWSRFLANRFQATIHACHCLDARLFGRMRLVSSAHRVEELADQSREAAANWVSEQLESVGLPGGPDNVTISVDAPAHAISELACDGYDMVVMGSRGERATERILLGSVAKKVIRSTCVPVLLVPAP